MAAAHDRVIGRFKTVFVRGLNMKRIAVCCLFVLAMSLGMVGCAEKSKVQETKKVETPSGSKTETTTTEEKKTGDERSDTAPKQP
jgi:hypothetical protein